MWGLGADGFNHRCPLRFSLGNVLLQIIVLLQGSGCGHVVISSPVLIQNLICTF